MRTNGWLLVSVFAIVIIVSAGVLTTSAFTSVTLSREATVSVSADDAAMVTLVDGHPGGGFVEETGGSTLAIDLTRGGAGGANANATVELGSTNQPITDHAFRVSHRGDVPSDLTFSYGLADAGEDGGPASIEFTFYHDAGDDGDVDAQVGVNENSGSTNATLSGVAPGDPTYAVVEFDTAGLSEASDLSGTLRITASGGA